MASAVGREAVGEEVPHPLGAWRAPKVSQKIAMAVVEDIVAKGLTSGDRLPPEGEMMQRFQASRASLREGLRLLETYGVITIRQGQRGGPRIGALTPAAIAQTLSLIFRLEGATYRDVHQARLLIEPAMARMAAEQQPPGEIAQLRELLELESASPPEEYGHAANRFHQLLSGLSGNPVLDLLGSSLRALYAERVFRGALPDEWLPFCKTAHPEIGAAILAGDGARAEALMAGHMTDLHALVSQRASWVMDERVAWEV